MPEQEPDRQTRDALGGDLFAALLADVRFPLPIQALAAVGMYGHAFVGGGNAALLTGPPAKPEYLDRPVGARAQDALAEFGRTFRWSAVRCLTAVVLFLAGLVVGFLGPSAMYWMYTLQVNGIDMAVGRSFAHHLCGWGC